MREVSAQFEDVVSKFSKFILTYRKSILGLVFAQLLLLSGCALPGKEVGRVGGGKFVERLLRKEEIPTHFDTTRTFFYFTNNVRPDSLLTMLTTAGFAISKAWYCEDIYYYCMDQFGPHFTIELKQDDPRILQYNFTRGDGRIHCAEQINMFVPAD